MALVGLVGWRGMVGSVLMDRMQAEGDFALIEPVFFSTSNAGGAVPASIAGFAKNEARLQDAFDIDALTGFVREAIDDVLPKPIDFAKLEEVTLRLTRLGRERRLGGGPGR